MAILAFSNLRFLVATLLVFLLLSVPRSEAAITCTQVRNALSECMGYLGGRNVIKSGCCPGIRSLQSLARTKQDRQAACCCLKKLANNYRSRITRAQHLVNFCHIRLNYHISLSVDCSKVA